MDPQISGVYNADFFEPELLYSLEVERHLLEHVYAGCYTFMPSYIHYAGNVPALRWRSASGDSTGLQPYEGETYEKSSLLF